MKLAVIGLRINFVLLSGLIFSLAPSSFAKAGADAVPVYLQEMKPIEEKVTSDYPVHLKIGPKTIDVVQKVVLRDCQISIKTFGAYGLLFQDFYKLNTWYHPHRVNIFNKYKTYALSFGIKPRLMDRSNLLFQSSQERAPVYENLKKYAHICHKSSVKGWFAKNPVSPLIAEEVSKVTTTYNEMTSLVGEEAFMERYRTAMRATKSIHGLYFVFNSDGAGRLLADVMMQKREQGLDVSLIIDSLMLIDRTVGASVLKNNFRLFNNLMAAGVRVSGYSCKGKFLQSELRGLDWKRLISRRHDKMWIVDGELEPFDALGSFTPPAASVAITGGMNISHEYFRLTDMGDFLWRDQDVAVHGSLVKEMYNAYRRNQEELAIRFKGYGDDKYCFNSFNPVTEREQYLDFKAKHTMAYQPLNEKEALIDKKVQAGLKNLVAETYDKHPTYVPVENSIFLDDRPWEYEKYIFKTYIDLIDKAQDEIIIENAYFIPNKELQNALSRASARGVKIKIITNSIETIDVIPLLTYASRYLYYNIALPNFGKTNPPDLPPQLRGPEEIKIYEWYGKSEYSRQEFLASFYKEIFGEASVKENSVEENSPRQPERDQERILEDIIQEGTLHSKFMLVDRKFGLVGSYNLSASSERNSEAAIVFESQELVKKMLADVISDLSYSKEITLEEMREFKNPTKFNEKFKTFLAKIIKDIF